MLIRINDNTIELVVTDRIPALLPRGGDIRLQIAISSHGFNGTGTAWLAHEGLASFLEMLSALEKTREGIAVLESMSPESFQLRIYSINRRGDIGMTGRLAHATRNGGKQFTQAIDFGFELDASLLGSTIADFRRLSLDEL